MHALGHTALALTAGFCARALLTGGGWMGGRSTPWETPGGTHDFALTFGLFGLSAVVLKSVGGVGAAYGQAQIAGEVASALRLEVLDAWLGIHALRHARQGDHGGAPQGGLAGGAGPEARAVAALTMRVRDVEVGLSTGVLGGARALAQLLPLLAALVWIAPALSVGATAVFVPFSALLTRTRRRWKAAHTRAAREGEELLEAADDAVRNADLWTTYGAEEKVRATVARIGHAVARRAAGLEASAAALSGANEILGALALVLTLAAARAGWLGRAADGGAVLSFTVVFFLAYRPLRDFTDARLALARASSAFDELRAMAPPSPAPPSATIPEAADWPLAPLQVRGVRVSEGGPSVSLAVEAGSIVAIQGPTGAGKTTLLRVLLGLDGAGGGEVLYDGTRVEGPPGPTSRPFAWVPQDAPLLADTLAANVSLGGAGDVHEALTEVGAGHLVQGLGSARLGAGGRPVSGGERQWIALARAIATRLPVLLLDEPTSGLDGAAEDLVLAAIARLRGQRSVVMVTHRAEPLAIADVVFRLAPPRASLDE